MKFGIDRLLLDRAVRKPLDGRRVALLAHPASVTADLTHSIDALATHEDFRLSAAFGPQHGMRGDKQDNMVETDDDTDPTYRIPVFSLYGKVRRPTPAMMETFDVLLVDLQDLGTRVYTFVTTLRYVLEEAARHGKAVWVLDRPNPIGRPVEGLLLKDGWESFVGAGPDADAPRPHARRARRLVREAAEARPRVRATSRWTAGVPRNRRAMAGRRASAPGSTRARTRRASSMARCYPGTVMVEGTTLSEGRGTTRPLELFGAPDIDADKLLANMRALAPDWLAGLPPAALLVRADVPQARGQALRRHPDPRGRSRLQPFEVPALAARWRSRFKAIRAIRPDYPLWREFPYEYETTRLAIDLINGGPTLREWVDDPAATPGDLDELARQRRKRMAVEGVIR